MLYLNPLTGDLDFVPDLLASVNSVAGRTGAIVLTSADVGLGNVSNTSDATKWDAVATIRNKTISGEDNTFVEGTIPITAIENWQTSTLTLNDPDDNALYHWNDDENTPELILLGTGLEFTGASPARTIGVNKTALNLNLVDNTSDANKPVSTATTTALGLKADLVGGVVPSAQIPAIAITTFLGNAANQAAMLAASGQLGDWVIRTDTGSTWIITGADPTQLADWTQLPSAGAPVTSVNSLTGSVTLAWSDVGAQQAHANLTSFAGLVGAADKLPYFTGVGTTSLTNLSAFGRSLIDDADGPAAWGTILGTASVRGISKVVHIAIRTDSKVGTGTAEDPFNAGGVNEDAKAAAFDAIIALFAGQDDILFQLGPGRFYTLGHWGQGGNGFARAGWELSGKGLTVTTLTHPPSISGPNTTVAFGSNGQVLPSDTTTEFDITVASTATIDTGQITVMTGTGWRRVNYASKDATHFIDCTMGTNQLSLGGTLATGNAVDTPRQWHLWLGLYNVGTGGCKVKDITLDTNYDAITTSNKTAWQMTPVVLYGNNNTLDRVRLRQTSGSWQLGLESWAAQISQWHNGTTWVNGTGNVIDKCFADEFRNSYHNGLYVVGGSLTNSTVLGCEDAYGFSTAFAATTTISGCHSEDSDFFFRSEGGTGLSIIGNTFRRVKFFFAATGPGTVSSHKIIGNSGSIENTATDWGDPAFIYWSDANNGTHEMRDITVEGNSCWIEDMGGAADVYVVRAQNPPARTGQAHVYSNNHFDEDMLVGSLASDTVLKFNRNLTGGIIAGLEDNLVVNTVQATATNTALSTFKNASYLQAIFESTTGAGGIGLKDLAGRLAEIQYNNGWTFYDRTNSVTRLSITDAVVNIPGSLTLGTPLATGQGGTGGGNPAEAIASLFSTAQTFPDNVRQTFNPGATVAGLNVGEASGDVPTTLIRGDIYYWEDDDQFRVQLDVGPAILATTRENSWADGVRQTFNPNGTSAGLNVGSHTADPSSPVNGDLFYDSDDNLLRARINGAWVSLGAGGGFASTDIDTLAELNAIVGDADLASLAGTETLSGKTLTAPKFADLGFIADANGNELLILDTVASAVNEITLANAATTGTPTFSATGGDTNINIALTAKGTGQVQANGPLVSQLTGGGEVIAAQGTSTASGYVSLKITAPKAGLYRSGADHILYYNTSTGDTTMDAVFGGAKLNFNIQGTAKWSILNGGGLVATTDNSYDIGASGATRPRTGYFGTSVVTPLLNKVAITAPATGSTLTIADDKTLTVSENVTVTSDGTGTRTLNIAAGGTLGTNAFTNVSTTKVYRALLTQTSTNAPVATVLENSLGGTVIWTRAGPGEYVGTLSGAFTVSKTFLRTSRANEDSVTGSINPTTFGRTDANSIYLSTSDSNDLADVGLTDLPVEILVYP